MLTNDLQLISNQAVNANITSNPQGIPNVVMYSIQAVFSGGTVNGSIKLQASADPCSQRRESPPNPNQLPTNWTDITGSIQSVVAAGSVMYNVIDPAYNWVRIVFTDASGGTSTGVLTATFNSKGA